MLDYINVKYWELAHSADTLGYHRNDDYSARCDVCGDSNTNKNKKRLHLYRKNTYEGDSIKCFNCDYTGNMYSYLRDYHPELFNAYKQETQQDKLSSLSRREPLIVREIKRNNSLYTFDKPTSIIPVNESLLGKAYVSKRGFPNLDCYFSTGIMNVDGKTLDLKNYIIIPLLENNKWYGFYSRSIESKQFHTYLPEQNTGWRVWNWFNVNKKEPVFIFEAIFNALSSGIENSIAVLGSDLDEERLKMLKRPIFCFDNDETGRKKAEKYADKGYEVVILHRDIRDDYNDMLKNGITKDNIKKLIMDNIYSGLKAKILLKV